MTKDVIEAIKERKSTRKFKEEPVNEATLGRVIEAGLYAPSAGNVQPWQLYIVHNKEIKRKLTEASFSQNSIISAPVVIVVGANIAISMEKYGDRGAHLYCLQDTACATQNMLLAATGFGLDTVWVGAFEENKVSEILDLPTEIRPVAIIPMGYGEETITSENPKRSIEEVVKVIR